MTATTDWAPPEAEPSALTRLVRRRPWVPPAAIGVGIVAATTYTWWRDPNQGGGLFPACPLKQLTGWDCPGCGGTRAVHALTHGDVATAFDHNVLLTIVVPLLGLLWALWLVRSIMATRDARRTQPERDGCGVPARGASARAPVPVPPGVDRAGVLAVGFGVLRNVEAVPMLAYLGSDAAGIPTPPG